MENRMNGKLSTIPEISAFLGVPYWRVVYVLRSRVDIRALAVQVGRVPAFDAAGVRKIATAIEQIDARRRDRVPA